MQHIGIRIENESGGVIANVELNFADVLNLLYSVTKNSDSATKFPWLSSIDPYGNTTLNYLQVPYLLEELKELSKQLKVGDNNHFKSFYDIFENFISHHEIHTYIKFIGD